MPEIPDVAPGEVIESVWGNELRDRSLQRYADETERDFLNGAPIEGELAWIENINTMQVYNGADWIDLLDTDQSGFPWLSQTGGTISGVLQVDGQTFIQAGSAAAPGLAFAGTDAGITRSGTQVRLASGGESLLAVDGDGSQQILAIFSGGPAAPAWTFNSDRGLGTYRVGASRLGFATGGQLTAQLSPPGSYATDVNDGSQTLREILVGTSNPPSNAWGKDGDIYMRFAP